jgi:polyhydroxyalkanoate synthase
LPNAASVRLEDAPGGHLGVLTGRAARGTTWVQLDRFLTEQEPAPARPRGRRKRATRA